MMMMMMYGILFVVLLLGSSSLVEGFGRISKTRSLQQSLFLSSNPQTSFEKNKRYHIYDSSKTASSATALCGWLQHDDGEWEWEEDDPNYVAPSTTSVIEKAAAEQQQQQATSTPNLPTGKFKPKQSLGQNYLADGNTVLKILRAFHKDATRDRTETDGGAVLDRIVELGPGAGALTDELIKAYGTNILQCIEIDQRAVELLQKKHPRLHVQHADVLQVNYPEMAQKEGQPLVVIGNLPYYITSQILFAFADASHSGAVHSATVTMQWEVAQRMVAETRTKDYGILSVVFQLYADVRCHFKIPPTVFYPQPKVDSALIGLNFLGPKKLRARLAGVDPANLRRVLRQTFQQRRKTVRKTLKPLAKDLCQGDADKVKALLSSSRQLRLPRQVQEAAARGDMFAMTQALPEDWSMRRPEELTPGQFIELTRLLYGPSAEEVDNNDDTTSSPLGKKVWRKFKHGSND